VRPSRNQLSARGVLLLACSRCEIAWPHTVTFGGLPRPQQTDQDAQTHLSGCRSAASASSRVLSAEMAASTLRASAPSPPLFALSVCREGRRDQCEQMTAEAQECAENAARKVH